DIVYWISKSSSNDTYPKTDIRGNGNARAVGGPGDLGDGNGDVPAPSWHRPEVHLHRGCLPAGRLLHGKERNDHQRGRDGAVASRGREAARGGQTGRGYRRPGIPTCTRHGE